MSSTLAALHGKCIAVTRPAGQAADLFQAINEAGGQALLLPLLEIEPVLPNQPFAELARQLHLYQYAIFISTNAVAHFLPQVLAETVWPDSLQAVSVGPSTAQAIQRHGINNVLYPLSPPFDSEALLRLAPFAADQLAQQSIMLIRGCGGRRWLAENLTARGARVDEIECYQRLSPPVQELFSADVQQRLQAVIITSSEALRYLAEGLDASGKIWLSQIAIFVTHDRIAEAARAAGCQNVHLLPAAESDIVPALAAYFG